MKKSPSKDESFNQKETLERMNKALKKAMETKPKPHKEMVEGRKTGRGKGKT